jgi:hypothetical protein
MSAKTTAPKPPSAKKMSTEEYEKIAAGYPEKFGKPGSARHDTDDLGTFVFKRPDRRQLGIYTKHMAEKDPLAACEFIALACVISCPTGDGASAREKLEDVLEVMPGLPLRFTATFNALAGTSVAVEGEA